MKRRRSSAPGRLRPDGRWSHPILLAVLLLAVAACDQGGPNPPATPTGEPSSEVAGPAGTSGIGPTVAASDAPSETASAASVEPSPSQASSSAAPGSAVACTGSDENRDFYASMAAAVDWTVYCPVLPDGWFVDGGQYRLAGGGWLEISYDGPGASRIILRQGAFCLDSTGCLPSGREVGEAPFGDRTAALVAGDDGSWSLVVDRGATRSWLLTVTGMDETDARTIGADLLSVAG